MYGGACGVGFKNGYSRLPKTVQVHEGVLWWARSYEAITKIANRSPPQEQILVGTGYQSIPNWPL